MVLWMLALLACEGQSTQEMTVSPKSDPPAKAAPAGAVQLATVVPPGALWPEMPTRVAAPQGTELIVRDCYGGADRELRPRPTAPAMPSMRRGSSASKGSSGYGSGAGSLSGGGSANGLSVGDVGGLGGLSSAAPMAEAPAEPAPAPKAAPAAAAAEPEAARPMPPAKREEAEPMADLAIAEAEDRVEAEEAMPPQHRSKWDWGATVYLSNDDSMSLASAQRLLWAVDQGRSFSVGEVRPHELLNYFSFETVPVAEGQLFTALGSAEREGDTLSLAVAVQGARPPRAPLDVTLVIDRSGSMSAEGRMEYVQRGLNKLTDQLVPGDRIDLTLFDSSVCTPIESFVVGRDDPAVLRREIERMQPRGSTDLDAGLREAYRIQTSRDDGEGRNRRVVLLTDAQLNSGNVDEDLVSEVGTRLDQDGIRLSGIGVGRDFNDTMLDKLTEKGKGAYVYLGSERVVDRVFGSGFESLVQTIAHDVHFSIELPQSLAMERFYGEESSTVKSEVQPIHYYAGTSQVFLQDLHIDAGALKSSDPLLFRIEYTDARTGETGEKVFHTTVGALLEGDARNLHKAQALMAWSDVLLMRAIGHSASCEGLNPLRQALARIPDDAELAYITELTSKMCRVDLNTPLAAFKVRVNSDSPIDSVELRCGSGRYSAPNNGNVATFEGIGAGSCTAVLQGNVPMQAQVEVPATGGQTTCMVRAGKVACS